MTQAPLDRDLIDRLDAQDWRGVQSTMFRLTKDQADKLRQALTGAGEPVGWERETVEAIKDALENAPYIRCDREYRIRDSTMSEVLALLSQLPNKPTSRQTPTPDPDTVPVRRKLIEEAISGLKAFGGELTGDTQDRLSQTLQVKP